MLLPITLLALGLSSIGVFHHKQPEIVEGEFAPEGMVAYAASYSDDAKSEPQWSTQNSKTFQYLNVGSTLDSYRGDSVKVGIIDSGINYDHEDFMVSGSTKVKGDSKYYEYQTSSWVYYKASQHGYSYIDDSHGHGTNVAATVAAAINGIGGLGLAPNVELYIYKVTNSKNGYEFGAIQNALLNAKTLGLDVVNMSFQSYEHAVSYGTSSMGASSGCSTILSYYLNQAYNAGITLVGAAGNYNTDEPSYPGSNNHVINVGSLNQTGTGKAGFSNYGSTIDLVAPGYVHVASKSSNTSYTDTSGTSFSAPLVTAAIALYKQKHPNASPAQIEQALYDSCDPISTDSQYSNWAGHGKLNVANFVGVSTTDVPTDIAFTNPEIEDDMMELEVGDKFDLTWTVNGIGNYDESVEFTVDPDPAGCLTVDNNGRITAVSEGYAIVTVTSKANSDVHTEVWVEITKPASSQPTVSSVEVTPSELDLDLNGTKSSTLTATVFGANNPAQTVSWSSSNENIATVSSVGEVTAKAEGTATITATSTVDSSKSGTCTVIVTDSTPPEHRVVIETSTKSSYCEYNFSSVTGTSGELDKNALQTYVSKTGGITTSTVKNSSKVYKNAGFVRLATGSDPGYITFNFGDTAITDVAITAKGWSNKESACSLSITNGGSITTTSTSPVLYEAELSEETSEIQLYAASGNRISISLITFYRNVTTSEDIGLTEDCLGLESFIEEYMHMDYTENLGWCSDSEHHYYSSAKTAFNLLNNHQRELFTTNEAYELEWARLSKWAEVNGDSLNNSNQLSSSNIGLGGVEQNQSSIIVIIVVAATSIASLGILLVIKKRRIAK